ncbi:hypothetical protein ESA_02958 [Cronobacter sakazakii ATCC BAA-894]|uniref:Uncharacterized protein n=1 Tax=Cronobacter sakazakii (strain ATCC BAA-894) TaxID=290339 RepID=A7MLS4_CROS8|nr:hypothetical protein ESA_02958 [Cronobacter sakazakii ATCC BAA-894]
MLSDLKQCVTSNNYHRANHFILYYLSVSIIATRIYLPIIFKTLQS